MAKRTPRKKHVAVEGVSSFFSRGFPWDEMVLRRLTTNDEECREGRDAAESHFVDWW
jgi:hypothetical protein